VFAFQDSRRGVDVAFTDRHGGVSGGSYTSLNLAQTPRHRPGDEAAAVEQNFRLVSEAFTGRTPAPAVVCMHQVHGADVAVVENAPGSGSAPSQADGLVTSTAGVVLAVRAADCVPVLLADVEAGVVAAAHAGRPGMVAGIVPAALARMRECGAERIVAWLGPHVCGRCYEVPEKMRAEVAAVVPESYAETSWGTPAVDVGAGVRAQLEAAGAEVIGVGRCTIEDEDLYSYRRQGPESGRMAGLIWLRP